MKTYTRYLFIAATIFILSFLLLPSGSAHRDGNKSTKADGLASNSAINNPQSPQEQNPAEELFIPVKAQDGSGSRVIPVLVEMKDAPAAQVYAGIMANPLRSESQKIAEARAATQAQTTQIQQKQEQLAAVLISPRFDGQEIYRVQRALNGIAIQVSAEKLAELRSLPDVKAVYPIQLEYPTTSTSVPFLGTPKLWGNSLGLNVKGDGIKIAIIDTGIDYQHADFGGSGLLADYQANNRAVAPDAYFPTAKVVGGTDFAGDNYNGSNTPVPDPDPMDCLGHGTHVAGIAAGFGVNSDGTTYTGPFNESANYGALRIGPGTAPGASLYALRVFGCGGGTSLTVQAIDWAMDPNGDNDLSDHLDVINMSLGSDFGSLANTTAMASDNAALAGVIVVASAGNSGDTYFISGSPGSGSRVIATAATVDSGAQSTTQQAVRANAPAGIAGTFYTAAGAAFGTLPPTGGLTGNVFQGVDAANASGPSTADGCSPLTNAAAVVGNIALIDRGTCDFTVKVKNAQDAGAIGVIIANSSTGAFGAMSGTDATITIPSVMVTFADGNTLKANISGLNVTLFAPTDTLASFSSRGPTGGGTIPASVKPDIAAPGLNITSAQTGVTCTTSSTGCLTSNSTGYIPGSQPLTISGTSMAAPHIAGIMALLRQLHPTWTVEELKALAMNGATNNVAVFPEGHGTRYGPNRVGAGRVDPVNSAQLPVVAYNAEEAGVISLTFNSEVLGSLTQTKKMRVVNFGSVAQTFDLGVDTVVDAPGVAFSLPGGNSITVPPGQTVEFSVQMSATASQMKHTRDATVAATQTAPSPITTTLNRFWLTEEAGYITLSQSGNLKLRVPVYSSPRAVAAMAGAGTIATGGAPTGSTTIPLSGSGVCTGTLGAGPTCTGTFPNDEVSLVTPFELQVASPRDTVNAPGYADLQYAGVSYDSTNNVVYFGVSTWENWSTPTDVSFNIYIDTDSDGVYDRILFNSNPGSIDRLFGTNTGATDAFIAGVFNISTSGVSLPSTSVTRFVNRVDPAVMDTAPFNSNVMFFGAAPTTLGLTGSSFRYKIVTCPGFAPLCAQLNGFQYDSAAGPYTYNYNAQGLNFNNTFLAEDLNGASLPVTWNTANMTADGSLGALLLHHHNAAGKQAQVVLLDSSQSSDLALTYSVSPPNPSLGQNVTLTLTVTNNGPNAATGVVVTDTLPNGLTYVSDDGGGAYNSSTGQWTVGALANTASATLHIVATVNTTDQVQSTAQITSGTPLDTNPSNNQASIALMSPRSADLALAMSVSSPTVLVGNTVSYTLTVTNNGDDPAYSINVNEACPAFPSLNPASFTASQGSYNPATGIWNLASLGKGFSATLTLNFTAPNIAGPLVEQATASSSTSDPNTANNTASATTTVLSPATVTGTKTRAGNIAPGSTETYTVVLSNSSNFDQQDNPTNEFTDVLPSALTLVSANATSGTATATVATNTVIWNGAIPAHGSVTITITATVNNGTDSQTISNQGTISYDADGNGTNEANALTDDPSVVGASNPTSFVVCPTHPIVTTNADSGAGSLRQAILDACPGATITFDMTQVTSPIILTGGELSINKDLTIQGPTSSSLIISGGNTGRVFNVASGTVAISNLTIVNGKSTAGAGILNQGNLTISNSTFTNNIAFGGKGGAIDSESGTLNVVNSTISGNAADFNGGGLLNGGTSTATLTNVTITSNRADQDGDNVGGGGGIAQTSSNSITLKNTIVAGNSKGLSSGPTVADDANGAFSASSISNLIGVNTGLTGISNSSSGNQVGTAASPINPLLGPLQNNGGPTQTRLLLPGSPAINAGNNAAATTAGLTTDQRGAGFARITNTTVDIGAVEVNYAITATAGTPQSAVINSAFGTQLKATVTESGTLKSGIAVTFTAPASGASGTFAGSGATVTVNTDANGVATAPVFTANGTAGGPYNVVASIGTGQPVATFALTNTQASTTTTVTSSSNPSTFNQSVTFTATVSSSAGMPSGTVQFKDNGANIGSPVALVNGVATFTTSALTTGSHTITAIYSGDGNFITSTGTLSGGQQVNQAATTTTVTSSVNPSDFGQSVTFTATVSSTAGTPSGTVQFKDNGTNLGSAVALVNGVASITTSTLSAGTHTITADYSGDANFATSTGTLSGGQVVRQQPTLSINDLSQVEGNSGTTSFNFTVTLSASSSLPVTVAYATANGTATAGSDYQSASGTLTFNPGDVTKTITVSVNGDTVSESDETFTVNLSAATIATISKATGTGTILNDDTPTFQLSTNNYQVGEGDGRATITITRTGDASSAVSVNYATTDQSGLTPCSTANSMASQRCDYATTVGTLRFAAGETSKIIFIPIVDDSYTEGTETFSIALNTPTGGSLGAQSAATVTIVDNDAVNGANPISGNPFFVRQHYIDLLGREPEPSGLQGWLNILNNCPQSGRDANGIFCDRIEVSSDFYRSDEFQQRGYFIYRFYSASLGRIPKYNEFIPDIAKVSGFLSTSDLEAAKMAFVQDFMNRAEFKTKYDPTLNDPSAYVNLLEQTAGVTLSNKQALITGLQNGTETRATVLRKVIESNEVAGKFFNEAFVVEAYFGYLRRDPDALYQQWIQIVNQSSGYRTLVNGFVNSNEYVQRFGQ